MSPERPPHVLIVDDSEMNRRMLREFVATIGGETTEACDGVEALETIDRHPFDLVLLDMMMPRMNGDEVLRELRADERSRELPIIMISALDDISRVAACINAGANDYLVKPFNPILLRARVNACLENKRLRDSEERHRRAIERHNKTLERRVKDLIEEISSAQLATIFAMSRLAESRDDETGEHLDRVREYCRTLAEHLAVTPPPGEAETVDEAFILNLYAASPLHDIGKVGIPDRILLKPGKLTDDEFALMKLHPKLGADTLLAVAKLHPGNSFVGAGIQVALSHHEKFAGGGYPQGLAGKNIPLAGRIMAVADVYDALTTKRCYKDAFTHEKSRAIILEERGRHFDPDIVDAFLQVETQWESIRSSVKDSTKQLIV